MKSAREKRKRLYRRHDKTASLKGNRKGNEARQQVVFIPVQRRNDAQATEEARSKLQARKREESMMSSDAKTSINSLDRTGNNQRHLKRIRPASAEQAKPRKLPYAPAAKCRSPPAPSLPAIAKLLVMLMVGLTITTFVLLATCFSFVSADGERTVIRRANAKPHTTNLAGASTAERPIDGGARAASTSSAGAPEARRSRRAARSQAAGRARSTTARPSQQQQQPPLSRQQQPASAEVESLAQQQQASRTIKNVTAQNGQSVLLHCLVEATASGELPAVSWFRGTSEPQLLTYETTTIIKDERFLVRQGVARPNDWALQIRSLNRTTDAGVYQCQASGDSPQLQSYQLNVVEPQVDILGAPDLAVRVGQPINLTCVISQAADELQFVFWYRDERMINFDFGDQGRAKIVLSKGSQPRDSITSNLHIFQSARNDSGNYTCAPSGARPSSIQVHVYEATDRRLMMFQQDESNPLAASSQQTNSAHVTRLGKGRAYAFLAALFILATWFQLIAQLQTLISLALLAVIGLLLGRGQPPATAARSPDGKGCVESVASDFDGARAGRERDAKAIELGGRRGMPEEAGERSDGNRAETGSRSSEDLDRGEADPLLRGAEMALSLLRTLSVESNERRDCAGPESCCSSLELDHDAFRSLSFGALDDSPRRGQFSSSSLAVRDGGRHCSKLTRLEPPTNGRPIPIRNQKRAGEAPTAAAGRAPKTSQASPSSSSSSAASTGYNSDSTRPCSSAAEALMRGAPIAAKSDKLAHTTTARAAPNVSLLDELGEMNAPDELEELQSELEVIELIKGRPTAMRLIIEHLQQSGQFGELAERTGGAQAVSSLGRSRRGGGGGGGKRPEEAVYSHPAPRNKPLNCDERPLDLSRGELDGRSASATFQRPD